MGFGRAGLYFWYELLGRLRLLGERFRTVGGPGLKKVSPSHLYCAVLRKLVLYNGSTQAEYQPVIIAV